MLFVSVVCSVMYMESVNTANSAKKAVSELFKALNKPLKVQFESIT